MNIYLVRHTPVDVAKGICYGQSEVPLSSTYLADLRALKKKLNGIHFDAIFSSPLKRCTVLANDLTEGAEVQVDRRLLELDFGDWELQPWDSIDSADMQRWADHFDTYPCPNGESFEDLRKRVVPFLKDIATGNQSSTVLVVAHGGTIRCLLAEVLGMPLRNAFNLQIDYGGVSCIRTISGLSTILSVNK